MTWLPVASDEQFERDAVLGLKQEPYDALRDVLTVAWGITDPHVLALCRLRLAQLVGARGELAGIDEHRLDELEHWEESSTLTEHERAALAFAEQYHYDHRLLSGGREAELERHLTRRELVNFVWALHMNDAYLRVLSLLDIAPDPDGSPIRPERDPSLSAWRPGATNSPDPDGTPVRSLMDPTFAASYQRFNPVVVRQSLIDPVTSEAVRLRNASHQGCLY